MASVEKESSSVRWRRRKSSKGIFDLILDLLMDLRQLMLQILHRKRVSSYSWYEQSSNSMTVAATVAKRGFLWAS